MGKKKSRTRRIEYKQLTREEEIAAWERGDHNALVESVWPFVILTIRKVAGDDQSLADELTGEAGLTLAIALKTYDARRTRFISYGCRFLKRHLFEASKRLNKEKACELASELTSDPTAIEAKDQFEREEERARAAKQCKQVLSALRRVLTESEREVLKGRFEGQRYRVIGDRNGVSRQRAQQLFQSARAKARELFPSLIETEA